MPVCLEEVYRILQICTYSELNYYAIIAQFTEVDKLDFFSQAIFSVKEMGGEKLIQVFLKWAEIHLEFLFSKPLQKGIYVFVNNPEPQMLKFHSHYTQYQINSMSDIRVTILDFTQDFIESKQLEDILQILKIRFQNYYPYYIIQHQKISQPQLDLDELRSIEQIQFAREQSNPTDRSENINSLKRDSNPTKTELSKWANKLIEQKIQKINKKDPYYIF